MGTKFEEVTLDVNHKSGILLAKRAKSLGVKSFVFASSCSMYGAASDGAKTEDSTLNPLDGIRAFQSVYRAGFEAIGRQKLHDNVLAICNGVWDEFKVKVRSCLERFCGVCIGIQAYYDS